MKHAETTTERWPIADSKHSSCGSAPLSSLDWNNWFLNTGIPSTELYISVLKERDDSWHRVHCRFSRYPRVSMVDGKLYWLVDMKGGK